MKIEVTWEIEDGYAGKSRPQHLSFDTDDFMDEQEWNDLPEKDKKEIINQEVLRDFNDKISYAVTDFGI